MSIQPDEETPLLTRQPPVQRTPLPWSQFSIVLFLQLAEPLTSQVIYPFVPQLIRDIGITHGNETQVAYYVGLMQSLFFFTQAMTVLHWSRTSDVVGRKPVILTGLFGLAVSMYCFGLSTTFWGLVLSRCLNGALNGNIGPIKSMMGELTDETNIAQAFSYFPLAWSTGLTLGPIIGGSLSRPAEQFPDIFGGSAFLKKYPYFLPCAVPATFTIIAWLVVFFFLKETVKNPTPISGILKRMGRKNSSNAVTKTVTEPIQDSEKPLPLRALLTPPVVVAAGNYAFLSLVDIAFRAVQPVFFSMPTSLGGLGLPPSIIGNILSTYGIFNGISQVFLFARLNNSIGTKTTFIIGIASALPMFACFPIISWLIKSDPGMQAGGQLSTAVWALVVFQTLLSISLSFSYGAVFIFITAASPNRASLGATNGLSQMAVSITRGIGPAFANSLLSLSLDKGYLGGYLVYYILMMVVCVGLFIASHLPRQAWKH